MSIDCDICGEELSESGALIFGPPSQRKYSLKLHLCKICWDDLSRWVRKRRNALVVQ